MILHHIRCDSIFYPNSFISLLFLFTFSLFSLFLFFYFTFIFHFLGSTTTPDRAGENIVWYVLKCVRLEDGVQNTVHRLFINVGLLLFDFTIDFVLIVKCKQTIVLSLILFCYFSYKK